MKIFSVLAAALGAALLWASAAQAAEEYAFDQAHSQIHMSWNHLGFSTTYARFNSFSGTLMLDEENPENSSLEVTVDLNSIDSGVKKLDEHLVSEDFFHTAEHPTATFKSTRVEKTGDNRAWVHGDLTLHGVTKPVRLDVTLNKIGTNPINSKKTAGFGATAKLLRSDFGLEMYVPMVSDEVTLTIAAEASPKAAQGGQ